MISDSGGDNISMIFFCQYYMSEGVNFSQNSLFFSQNSLLAGEIGSDA